MEEQVEMTEETTEESGPYRTYATEKEHQKHLDNVTKDRVERAKAKAKAELLEKLGVEDEDELAEVISDYQTIQEATQTEQQALEAKAEKAENARKSLKENLQTVEAERDQAKERSDTLAQLVSDFVTPRLEQLPEHYRELLDEWPVEKQAGWLTKNADKLTETSGNGAKPAGSRPTGRPATPPREELDKQARENQSRSRVSAI